MLWYDWRRRRSGGGLATCLLGRHGCKFLPLCSRLVLGHQDVSLCSHATLSDLASRVASIGGSDHLVPTLACEHLAAQARFLLLALTDRLIRIELLTKHRVAGYILAVRTQINRVRRRRASG
jgi:hypothetical protein